MRMVIYLCGSINKGAAITPDETYWGTVEESLIYDCANEAVDVKILNPATAGLRRDDPYSNYGGDLCLIQNSDFLFVDARSKRGIGIGSEMVAAKYFSIPVVTLCPKNSHYRKDSISLFGKEVQDWTHPFIVGLSDYIVDNIPDAMNWMLSYKKKEDLKNIKNINSLEHAIDYFKQTQPDVWEKIQESIS